MFYISANCIDFLQPLILS